MRVTNSQFTDSLVSHLSRLTSRQNRLQNEAATGKRVQNASDDPVAAQRLLDLQARSSSLAQYQKNIGRLQDTTTLQYSTLRSLQKVSDRAGEIATLADELKSPDQLEAYAKDIDKLIAQSVTELNRQHGDGYLYGGTKTDRPPFTVETDADGKITAVNYGGNEAGNDVEVAEGATLSVTTPGANATGTGPRGLVADPRSGADLFKHLIELRDRLRAGDTTGIKDTSRADLSKDEGGLVAHLGEIGATQARLDAAASSASERLSAITTETSHEGDADLAETLVRLNQTQTAYQATLQSAARIMEMSLMNYLR